MEKTELQQWLDAGLRKPGKTKGGLAKALRVHPSAVTGLLNGSRRIQVAELPLAAGYLGEPIPAGTIDFAPPAAPAPIDTSDQPLKLLGEVAAGVWLEADADFFEELPTSIFPDPRYSAKAQFVLRNRGESMNMFFDNGTLLHVVDVVKAKLEPRQGDVVIVERRRASGEREVSAKRMDFDPSGRVIFKAQSREDRFKDYVLSTEVDDGESIVVAGVVLKAVREFR